MKRLLEQNWLIVTMLMAVAGWIWIAIGFNESPVPRLIMLGNVMAYLLLLRNKVIRYSTDLLDARLLFFCYWGWSFLLPITLVTFTDANYSLGYRDTYKDDSTELLVTLCVSIGLIAMAQGMQYNKERKKERFLLSLDGRWPVREAYVGSFFLIITGFALLYLLIAKVGLSTYWNSDYAETYLMETGLGYLSSGVFILRLGLLVLFIATLKQAGWKRALVILLFVVAALLVLRTGRRRIVIDTCIAVVTVWHYLVRPIRHWQLVAALIVIAPLMVFIGQWRSQLRYGAEAALEHARNDFTLEDMSHVGDDGQMVYLTLAETIKKIVPDDGYSYGETFVDAFRILIPSALVSSRPLAPGERFAREYDPVYAARGGGFGYSLTAEGYLNFGLFGVWLISYLLGRTASALVSFRKFRPESQSRTLVYAVSLPLIISFVRWDFASVLKVDLFCNVLPAVLAVLWLGRAIEQRIRDYRATSVPDYVNQTGFQPGR